MVKNSKTNLQYFARRIQTTDSETSNPNFSRNFLTNNIAFDEKTRNQEMNKKYLLKLVEKNRENLDS